MGRNRRGKDCDGFWFSTLYTPLYENSYYLITSLFYSSLPPSLPPSYISSADGERGPPSHTVDQQRNRILATAALKKAEPLAAQGTNWMDGV